LVSSEPIREGGQTADNDDDEHCCDYGHPDQMGLESTPEAYVAGMVGVFREVRRCLRDDGVLWLNIGDSYASATKGSGGRASSTLSGSRDGVPTGKTTITHETTHIDLQAAGLKPKDLIGIPWMLAFALRADGWYLRSDVIWHKPNPMPESVTDRPTKAHEYVFLLTKSERYYFDAASIAETSIHHGRVVKATDPGTAKNGQKGKHGQTAAGFTQHDTAVGETRNARTVWSISSQPYRGAHYAVMPPALARRCVLSGCPIGGIVLDPFFGSGTVGQVCDETGRQWCGIELNPDHESQIKARTAQAGLPFGGVS
jgi:DNA modification methylase